MQAGKLMTHKGRGLFAFAGRMRPLLVSVATPPVEARGLSSSVRFFVDHTINVAVNAVARRQAIRARLSLSGADGLSLGVVISMVEDNGENKFVAYSSDTALFLSSSSSSLYVISQSPRELEHSIYLYLSERLTGQKSVGAQLARETNTPSGLPLLVGSSEEGPRSLHVRQAPAEK